MPVTTTHKKPSAFTRTCDNAGCDHLIPESQRYCPPCVDELLVAKHPEYIEMPDSLLNRKMPAPIPTAHKLLEAAQGHMRERAVTYDKPAGERSMGATVAAFNAVTGQSVTELQGWLMMVILKAVRSQQGEFKLDNFEDGAAYFALAGEAAAAEADQIKR